MAETNAAMARENFQVPNKVPTQTHTHTRTNTLPQHKKSRVLVSLKTAFNEQHSINESIFEFQ